MSQKCQLTGKKPLTGNNVSHANNKTKRRQIPNLQRKRIYVEELQKFVRVRISCKAIRIIDKMGLTNYLKKQRMVFK